MNTDKKFYKAFMILLLISALTACTGLPDNYSYSSDITENQLIDGVTFLGSPLKDDDLPDADIMAVSPEMDEFLNKYILGLNGQANKAKEISRSLFDQDKLGLSYNPKMTYTAGRTFSEKQGNCLAFSYLYSALARKAGLKVKFQQVNILPEWDYSDDEIYVESGHVNIRVNLRGKNDLIVDINQVGADRELDYDILDENHILTLYYGNVAAEYLLNNQYQEAYRYFVKAIKMKAEIPSLWANLGVLYKRSGNNEFAEKSYYTALKYDNKNMAALNNLAILYEETGDILRADYYTNLVSSYQNSNPYFRFVKAQKAMESFEYKAAMAHIKYAIRKKKNEPRFHKLKSEIHADLGQTLEASKAMRTAQKIEAETL